VIILGYFGWARAGWPGKSIAVTLPIILDFQSHRHRGSYGVAWFRHPRNTVSRTARRVATCAASRSRFTRSR